MRHVVDGVVHLRVAQFDGNQQVIFEHKVECAYAHFLVLADGENGAGGIVYSEILARLGVGGHGDGSEDFLDLVLDVVHVDVADNYDGLLVGAVPCVVVVAQNLRVEVVDHLHRAYGQTVAVAAAGIYFRELLFDDAHGALVAAAPFFVDHTAFGVDFFIVESQGVGPVVEDKKARVLHAGACDGYRRDIVDSFVHRCVGIEVVAEFHAYRLKIVDDAFAGEILGAVEAHVFKEVGEAALVVFLKD